VLTLVCIEHLVFGLMVDSMQMLVGVVCQSLHNMILQTFHFAGCVIDLTNEDSSSDDEEL